MKMSHAAFCVAYPAALYAGCNLVNLDKLTRWFQGADGLAYAGFLAYLAAGLCLFIAVFALLAHRWTTKPLAVLLTVLSAAVTYFIAKYDVAFDSSMLLNTLHTDGTEVRQLLSPRMLPYVFFLMVVPIGWILWVEISYPPAARYLWGSLGLFVVTLGIAVGLLYLNYGAIHRAGNISNKYIVYSLVPVNIISSTISVASKSVRNHLRSRRKDVDIPVRVSEPDDLVVVLAIGESSRRKNFSLYGYQRRDTNPMLGKQEGLHLLNGIARRGSTLQALREILEKDEVKLTALASRAGIPTACFVNYTLYDNCAAVGEVAVKDCGHAGKCHDEDVIPLLEDRLAKYASGYELLILHLGGGSHGPAYSNRYPPEFQKFRPMCNDADVANRCTLDELYNSYDNTILYVDHVLGRALQVLDRSGVPYVFIYLSDHGESLMEDGVLFHGMPPGIPLPREQAEIPLIVKSSLPISIVQRAEYRQPELYDTILDLLSLESPKFDKAGSFIKKGGGTVSTRSASQGQDR